MKYGEARYIFENEIKQMPTGSTWLLFDEEIISILNTQGVRDSFVSFGLGSNTVIYIKGVLKLFYYYIRQFFLKKISYSKNKPIILDVNRGYDYKSIINFTKLSEKDINFINSFDFNEYMELERVSLTSLYCSFKYLFQCYVVIQKSGLPCKVKEIARKNAQQSVPAFSYLQSFFLSIASNFNGHIYTGGALITLQIAAYSGLKCSFMHHGLMGFYYPGLIRGISNICVYSRDEKQYLESIGINSKISVYQTTPIERKNHSVIIFSREENEGVDYQIMTNIVQMFLKFGYKVILKPHPRVRTSTYMESWCKSNNVFMIDKNGKKQGSLIIKEERPSFVVGVFSTTLCESLNMGVIPINARGSVEENGINYGNSPYNFDNRCLSWEFESNKVYDILAKKDDYSSILNVLKSRVHGGI